MICKEEGCGMVLLCSKCASIFHPRHYLLDLDIYKEQIMENVGDLVSKAKTKIGELDNFDTSSHFRKLEDFMKIQKATFWNLQSKIIALLQTEMKRTYSGLRAVRKRLRKELKDYQQEKESLKKIEREISEKMIDLNDTNLCNSNSLNMIEKCRTEVNTLSKYAESKVEEMKNKNISQILERIIQTEISEKKTYLIIKERQEETILNYIQVEITKLNEKMSKILNGKYNSRKSPPMIGSPDSASYINLKKEEVQEITEKNKEEVKVMELDPCQLCSNIVLSTQISFLLECGHLLHINCIKNHRNFNRCPNQQCRKPISENNRKDLGLIKIQHNLIPKGVPSQRDITNTGNSKLTPQKDTTDKIIIGSTGCQYSSHGHSIQKGNPWFNHKKCAYCTDSIESHEEYLCICELEHNIHTECVRTAYISEAPKICPLSGCNKKISTAGKLAIEKEILKKKERRYSDANMCSFCHFPLGIDFIQFTCNHKFHTHCLNEIYPDKDTQIYKCHVCGNGTYEASKLYPFRKMISLPK